MGFSLYLYKIDGNRLVDPDRDGVQEFLRRRRMHMKVIPASSTGRSSFATLLNEDGFAINVDGLQDFHFSNMLEEDEAMTAGTGHAHLTAGECDFTFDLHLGGLHDRQLSGRPQLHRPAREPHR